MAIQNINVGSAPNDKTGDKLRAAFIKANENFAYLDGRRGAPGGVAPLGADAKIPAAYLPGFVDDVVEYNSLADFPTPGESGKLYVALDTEKIYRWGGSVYVEISPSPGSTDAVPEGEVNKYYTWARTLADLGTNAPEVREALDVPSYADLLSGKYGLSGSANRLINPNMVLMGRPGAPWSIPTATGKVTLDRWYAHNTTGGGVYTVARATDSVANTARTGSVYRLHASVTQANTNIASDGSVVIRQAIEGFNIADLIGNDFVISFWAGTNVPGTYHVALRCPATAQYSYVSPITLVSGDNYCEVKVPGGLTPTAAWNLDTNAGLYVDIVLAAGASVVTSSLNQWIPGLYMRGSTQVNFLSAVGNAFSFTSAQLKRGQVATPFTARHVAEEIALARRYFEGGRCAVIGSSHFPGGFVGTWVSFLAQKRAVPTITFTDVLENNNFNIQPVMGAPTGFRLYGTTNTAENSYYTAAFYADAEII